MSNDIHRIKPYDKAVEKRVRIIPYEKQYVDEPENSMQLKKDPNIDKELQTELFKQVFISLLILRYDIFVKDENSIEKEPEEVVSAKQEWTGDDGSKYKFVDKFLEDYEITNDETHFTASKKLEEWMKNQELGISFILFTKELKQYCAEHNYNAVCSKTKNICGKVPRVWVGIRERRYNPEQELEEDGMMFEKI